MKRVKRQPLRKSLGSNKKTKLTTKKNSSSNPINSAWDEDIESSDEDDDRNNKGVEDEDEQDEEEMESADQKRKRLAKQYLESMMSYEDDSDEAGADEGSDEERGGDAISARLRKQRLEAQGKYFRSLASKATALTMDDITTRSMSGHKNSVTCVCLTSDDSTIYSGSKDNALIRWDAETGARQFLRPRWSRKNSPDKQAINGEVLSVAVTTDGRYVVSGGRDNMVRVFDSRTNAEIKCLSGHRDAVTSLAFRRDTYSLFSGSSDRCLKHWDLNEMGYIETMFGHQDGVNGVDCWTKERPISCSNDRTVRVWKISDETHLVFRGHKTSADCVQLLTDDTYLSGGQDGSLRMWKETQKRSVATIESAHGFDNGINARWIASLATFKMSDYAATGSHDGYVRLWNVNGESRKITPAAALPLDGFVNGIALSTSLIVAGTGCEHRLGRWWHLKGNQNKVVIMRLPSSFASDRGNSRLNGSSDDYNDDEDDDDDDDDDDEDDEDNDDD